MRTLILLLLFALSQNYFGINRILENSEERSDSINVYLVKYNWHVGILISIDSISKSCFPFITEKTEGKFIDIGWGDEEFYQNEETDYALAAKAILWPTSSVVRTGVYYNNIESISQYSDYCVKFSLNQEQFGDVVQFINDSFDTIGTGGLVIVSEKSNGRVIFYKSVHSYHLFYTCNTWVAEALNSAGFDIDPDDVITANELFYEVSDFGQILKYEED